MMTLFRSSPLFGFCVLLATICLSHGVHAYELHVNWQRGQMTAALIQDTDSHSISNVRLASPTEYHYHGAELPEFYSEITTSNQRNSNSALTLASPFVRNPTIFDLLFVAQNRGTSQLFGFIVALDGNRTTVQQLIIDDDVISDLPQEHRSVARPNRTTPREFSSEIQNLLDQLSSRQSGDHYQPDEVHTEPFEQQEGDVIEGVEDNILATAHVVGELQGTPQPDATMSTLPEGFTNLRPSAAGLTPNVASPDFVLNAAIVASDLSHFKTVFVIASFFVFFLGLSLAVMFVIRGYAQVGGTASSQFDTRHDSNAAEKLLELQSAQLTLVIDMLVEGYRSPLSQINTAVRADEDIQARILNDTQDAAKPNTASINANMLTGTEYPSPTKPVANPVSQGEMPTRNVPAPAVYSSPEQPTKSEVKEKVSNQREFSVEGLENPRSDRFDMNLQQKKSEKLDLISVYRDMGDLHMARSLARDLIKSGDELEKVAAQKILDELK